MSYKKLFDEGITFEEFYETAQQRYKNYANYALNNFERLNKYMDEVKGINRKINILAVAVNWCIDCIMNLPVLFWLEQNSQNVTLKIVDVESYKQYFDEEVLTPTLIIMDEEFNVIDKWIQYPKKIKEVVAANIQYNIVVEKQKYRRGEYVEETLQEILDIINQNIS